MRKNKKPAPQPESIVLDRSPIRQKFWIDLSTAIGVATTANLPRIVVIEEMTRAIENLVEVCDVLGEDLSALKDLS